MANVTQWFTRYGTAGGEQTTPTSGPDIVPTSVTVTNLDTLGGVGVSWTAPSVTVTHYLVEITPAPTAQGQWPRYAWVSSAATSAFFHGDTSGTVSPAAQVSSFANGVRTFQCRVQGWNAGVARSTGGPLNNGWSEWSGSVTPTYRRNDAWNGGSGVQPLLNLYVPHVGALAGVTPGTTMTTQGSYASPVSLLYNTNGQTISNQDIWSSTTGGGGILVRATGVTFNNCRFRFKRTNFGNGQGGVGIQMDYNASPYGSATFNNCEFDGGGAGGGIYGLAFGNYTLNNCISHGWGHNAQSSAAGQPTTIYRSLLVDTALDSGVSPVEHLDAIQVDGVTGLSITDSMFICVQPTSPILIQGKQGAVLGATVNNNLLMGGGYTLQVDSAVNSMTGISLTNNKIMRLAQTSDPFGTGIWTRGGFYGPTNIGISGVTTSNNVWDGPTGGTAT